jgi:hypothetical protein
MSISKELLETIAAAPTAVESFKATLDALVVDQTITADVAGIVKLAVDHHKDALEPALAPAKKAKGDK